MEGGSPGSLSPYSRCEIYWKIVKKYKHNNEEKEFDRPYLIIKLGYVSSDKPVEKRIDKEFNSHYDENGLLKTYTEDKNQRENYLKEWNHKVLPNKEPKFLNDNYITDFTPGTLAAIQESIGHITILQYLSANSTSPILCISDKDFNGNIDEFYNNIISNHHIDIPIKIKENNHKIYYIPPNWNFQSPTKEIYLKITEKMIHDDYSLYDRENEDRIREYLYEHIQTNNYDKLYIEIKKVIANMKSINYLVDNNEFYITPLEKLNEDGLLEQITVEYNKHIEIFKEMIIDKDYVKNYLIPSTNILKHNINDNFPLDLDLYKNSCTVKSSFKKYDNNILFNAINTHY